ncbi:PX domain-containing protein [Endogone sp. FLAS-F59071]|nr:PX domain-containing protein [Endogone sp. FLAS-F59071]|eukprot:RUS23136.1 PX domain-containing protein [Endogone sp. FLAS-F59071]
MSDDEANYRPISQPQLKSSCGCSIDRAIHRNNTNASIIITGAQKQSDGSGGNSYVAYSIHFGNNDTKRRYSDFESLRKALSRLHPTVIVPPIPEKHSLSDYATMQRVKDDIVMIEKRKRMLQSFLNRVAQHPDLSYDHVFHRFLETSVSWAEVLHSPPLSTLPKNLLQTPLITGGKHDSRPIPTASTSTPVYSSSQPPPPSTISLGLSTSVIPIPSSTQTLRNPDLRFVESELFTNRFAQHMSSSIDKTQRRVVRRLGDLANDYAELGAVYNGFSLNEVDTLANAIEKVGQAVDSSYTATGHMVTALESDFAEPVQEYIQYAQTIKQVLNYRHLKHAQVELIADSLESKRSHLETLLRMENEARRLDEALKREHSVRAVDSNGMHDNFPDEPAQPIGNNQRNGHLEDDSLAPYSGGENGNVNPYASYYSQPNPVTRRRTKRWSGPTNIFSALSHTVQGIIDVDPEATRRNQIGKTRDAIVQLEEAHEVTRKDLVGISADTQADLDRFQRQKVRDMRDMLLAYAKIHAKWCQKNLGSWEEARAEVEKIQV